MSYKIRYATQDLYGPEREGLELEIEFYLDSKGEIEIEDIHCLNPDVDYFKASMLTSKDIVKIAQEIEAEMLLKGITKPELDYPDEDR